MSDSHSTIVGSKVIIVGGGLAGLSAAHTVLERGGRALVLDKKEFLGGNSVKATSGINGALTNAQVKLGIPDSAELFEKDTALSANKGKSADSTPLIHTLVYESAPAVDWLIEKFNLDLSLISRLGGHTQPRTHRGKEKFPGMTITYALMEKFEELTLADPTRACVIPQAKVTKLIYENGIVIGCDVEIGGKTYQEYGPIIICTGGFGADFSQESILQQVRPDLMHLPTTNGDHCTGDGIKMAVAIGGATIDLPAVQVHPTGLVHPKDPDAKIKFLAAEALRGVGGILLDSKGARFSNELGTRDYVTGEMWKSGKAPFRLLLNSKGVKEIEWHCKHYVGRGLMKHFKNGDELAKDMNVSPSVIANTFKQYNAVASAGSDEFGKKYFQNMPWDMKDEFHVSIVTPVIHYCMGGVQIDEEARLLRDDKNGKGSPIPGLYAGGEVAGGVHGKNRLGGSGLLGAVVYGRVAGASAAKYQFNQLSEGKANSRLNNIAGQLFSSVNIQSKNEGIVITLGFGDKASSTSPASNTSSSSPTNSSSPSSPANSSNASPSGTSKKSPPKTSEMKEYSLEEVGQHNKDNDCWVVVNGQVLNATSFLEKHPGGKEAILLYAGKDATEEFNMLHKPDVVQKYAPEIIIGTIKGGSAGGDKGGKEGKGAPASKPATAKKGK